MDLLIKSKIVLGVKVLLPTVIKSKGLTKLKKSIDIFCPCLKWVNPICDSGQKIIMGQIRINPFTKL